MGVCLNFTGAQIMKKKYLPPCLPKDKAAKLLFSESRDFFILKF